MKAGQLLTLSAHRCYDDLDNPMTFPAPVPEIPVASIDKAATYYVNKLGFTFDWGDEQGGIAGISRSNCRLFLAIHTSRKDGSFLQPALSGLGQACGLLSHSGGRRNDARLRHGAERPPITLD
jgi:hypothetical protein